MAVAAAQKNREMFAIKKSYSIEVRYIQNSMFSQNMDNPETVSSENFL